MDVDGPSGKITPNIHFAAEKRRVVEGDKEVEVQIVQLVRTGEILATLPGICGEKDSPGDDNADSQIQYELISGDNTELSLDKNTLTATKSGYPSLFEKKIGRKKNVTILISPLVTVSNDKMYASITLHPGVTGKEVLSPEDLENIFAEEGIIYGVDDQTIRESLERLHSEGTIQSNIIAARGILPLHGKNASFRFEIEVGPIAGKLLRNGQIDFRDRKVFVSIEENELIATLVPATDGTPGQNIFGDPIPQKSGRNIKVLVSGDVSFCHETSEVRASSSGILSIVNENTIKVSAKLVITGDVDYSVGNIESKDSVEISGTIMPEFSVTAFGDVVIGCNVQSASVTSKANTVIKGGLVGNKSSVKSRGDVDVKFVENGKIQAGGNVIIRQASYYSNIVANGSIHCCEESKVIGGMLLCGKNVSIGDVGSYNAEPATIAAGVSSLRFTLLRELKSRASELMTLIDDFWKLHGESAQESQKVINMAHELHGIHSKLGELNLLPETPENSRNEPFMNYSDVEIHVHGTITAGTNIRIGNIVKTLDKDYNNSRFILDAIQQSILIEGLEERS